MTEEYREYETKMKSSFKKSYYLMGVALLTPFIACLLSGLRPFNETIPEWFQRSGSIMVFIAATSEFNALRFSGLFNAMVLDKEQSLLKQDNEDSFNFIQTYSFILMSIGTLIWGYGDSIMGLFI